MREYYYCCNRLYRVILERIEVFDHLDDDERIVWVGVRQLPPGAQLIIPEAEIGQYTNAVNDPPPCDLPRDRMEGNA